MTEAVVTSPTGGRKGQKRAQLGAVDPRALLAVAEVAGHGTEKYARYNYMNGYNWSLSFDAALRHALAFWGGENVDPESGLPHAAHAAWHFLALLSFTFDHPGYDDRPPAGDWPGTEKPTVTEPAGDPMARTAAAVKVPQPAGPGWTPARRREIDDTFMKHYGEKLTSA
jgi:hypothetical protein